MKSEFLNPAVFYAEHLKSSLAHSGVRVELIGDGISSPKLGRAIEIIKEEKLNGPVCSIVDIDGVLISPIHFQKRIGYERLKRLSEIIRESDHTVLWTSRFSLKDSPNFPYFGPSIQSRFQKVFGEKLEIITNKKSIGRKRGEALQKILDENPQISKFVYIGSSPWDGEAVRECSDSRLIFLTTCHLFL
ncbi:MAG: hypothetical protein HY044_04100 [Candidatus Woesebacteria bacterium]|nr:MAG: hypothetical protein HY044_04100 [Candidatus Woesebacteria bacterium]